MHEVDTEAQRVAAMSAAEKAAGGVRITSNVQVRALENRSPTEQLAIQQSTQLVREVEAALKADLRTSNLDIAVFSADPHIIVVQGLVPSRDIRTAVQSVVSKVRGVNRVDTPADTGRFRTRRPAVRCPRRRGSKPPARSSR
jgi:osmotically-inducible protein OsmY